MPVGLISDTHDNIQNLRAALEHFRQAGITQVIHCGDLSSTETARELGGFQVIYVQGNMDSDSLGIRRILQELNPENFAGPLYTGDIEGIRFAAVHGNVSGMVADLAASGKYAYIFHGHTHRRRDTHLHQARVINPGALGGLGLQARSFCILDLKKDEVRFIELGQTIR